MLSDASNILTQGRQVDAHSQHNEITHILIVDDDDGIREIIGEYLSVEGYRVSTASHGDEMRRILAQSAVDLVLLDLLLPGEDGLALARKLREQSNVGIIMMSGRGETLDRIIGLEMGSDDYLAKPFEIRELLARIRSLLRRTRMTAGEQGPPARRQVRFAGWTFDPSNRELFSPLGDPVRLTTGEFDLLTAFVASPNQVLSRDRLLELTRGRRAGPIDRTIDVQVGRLRRKLRDDNIPPRLIKAVRGAGYIFNTPVETIESE
jgi:two-component system OmpR family response regulator